MRCPRCESDNPVGSKFCIVCGIALRPRCPGCGVDTPPQANFCGECGTPLIAQTPGPPPSHPASPRSYTPGHLAEKILTSRVALEGERKQVTVLFADIKGSLEWLADRDPEEARQLLDPVLERMIAAVHRYEGTVNQVLGDGIMALFGAPIAHEDHAVRAGYAALTMQEAIATDADRLRRQHGISLQIRVGLNAGEVVVRGIGNDLAMDYTAVGQTTHLAARMEQLASPGTIQATAAFARLTEAYLRFKSLGLVSVKGLAVAVEVFELIGAESARTHLQAAVARGLTRFVGRHTEIQAIEAALARAGSGHGQLVAVIGEPGMGKSRLVYEFITSPPTQDWLILETSTVSYDQATPYLPVRRLLTAYFHIDDWDDEWAIREKVDKCLALDTALQPTRPVVLALLDVAVDQPEWQALDPPRRRLQIIDGVKRLLLRRSQVQPLLVVVENLHWIDTETQALLDSMVESLPGAHLLLVVSYRPEYHHGWGSKSYYTQLRLDPLPPESAAELLQPLLGDDTSLTPLTRLLIEWTAGNPFFLEESVRTLVEAQALGGERGAYRLTKALPSLQVPATVEAVLAARMDRLPPEEKRLLQTAAVIGTDVPLPLLQAIAGLSEEAFRHSLTHLQAAEFLREMSLFPELVYTFTHALTQEVASRSLLREQRRALHARIVEAIERLAGERLVDQVERLALHAFRGEVWVKALGYLRQAGDKAMARSAYRQAVVYYEQALDALARLPASREMHEAAIDLRFSLRNVLLPLGEQGRILDHLCQAATLAETLQDQPRQGWVSIYMTSGFYNMGQPDHAVESGERALAMAILLGDVALHTQAAYYLGLAYHLLGNFRQAVDVLGRNVASLDGQLMHERFGLPYLPAVFSRTWLVWCLAELGAFAEGSRRAAEGVQIAEASTQPWDLIAAYRGVGLLALGKGEIQTAIAFLERGLDLCRVWDISGWFAVVASQLGYAYALAGRLSEALPLLEQAVGQPAAKRSVYHARLLGYLSEAYLLDGRPEEALPLALSVLELSRNRKERGFQAWGLWLLGEITARRHPGEVEPAEAHYHQALALAEDLGMRPLMAHCRCGLGRLYATVGRQEQARAELAAANELYRSMDMTFWLTNSQESRPARAS